jgi:flagellar basal-body rod modification protein FlgD
MDVNATTTPAAASAAARTAATTAAATAEAEAKTTAEQITGDFDTFLQLLTAQLRNQDPLKPTESTEFVAQLATFSGVEQQVRANDRLDRIVEVLSGGTSAGLAAWIGQEVRGPAQGAYAGVPVEMEVSARAEADRAVLVVKNDFGQEVLRRAIEPDAVAATWDGRNALGEAQPQGLYNFSVESYAGETLLGTDPAQVYSKVTEIRIEDGETLLVLEGGGRVALGDVTALR